MKPRKKLRIVEPEEQDRGEEKKHLRRGGDNDPEDKDESSKSDNVVEDEDEEAGKPTKSIVSLTGRRHGYGRGRRFCRKRK
jgi:hypothetical protein